LSITVTFSNSMAYSDVDHNNLRRVTDPNYVKLYETVAEEYVQVGCTYSYNPIVRELTITPDSALTPSSVYAVSIDGAPEEEGGVQDIDGSEMLTTFVSMFTVAADAVATPELIIPTDQETITASPITYTWENIDETYVFQLSTEIDFSTISIEETVADVNYTPSFTYETGAYFWRVKAVGGTYSPSNRFYYDESVEAGGSQEGDPVVASSYPSADMSGTTPTDVKIKFSIDVSDLGLALNTDIFLLNQEFDVIDIVDLDILPLVTVPATLSVSGQIVTITPDEAFSDDSTYTVVMTGALTDGVITFTTAVTSVAGGYYGDLQDVLDDLNLMGTADVDYVIRKMVLNSQRATEIQAATDELDDSETDFDNPPTYIIDYVRYKTVYDILNKKYMELTMGSVVYTLGDFQVETSVKMEELQAFINNVAAQLKKFEDALYGRTRRGYARPVSTLIKQTEDSKEGYPDMMDRRLSGIDGTKED
ncbi:MAG: Ig-like domain-containing protein, partial [Candidatus Bathyarchaeota archaeon]|nr:Ig-like domain-containing protein [Candidatus Bathyarchaeota archaeon]